MEGENGRLCKRETDTRSEIKGRSGGGGGGGVRRSRTVEQHLWVALLIRYLQEVDGVAEGSLLQRQGEDQGELLW